MKEEIGIKYKCIKAECQVCGKVSSIQLIFRSNGELAYARARHYVGMKDCKPQFEYHPHTLESMKTLLKTQNISHNITAKTDNGQIGQVNYDLNKAENCFDTKNLGWSSSLVRTLALRAKGRRFKSGSAHHIFAFGA